MPAVVRRRSRDYGRTLREWGPAARVLGSTSQWQAINTSGREIETQKPSPFSSNSSAAEPDKGVLTGSRVVPAGLGSADGEKPQSGSGGISKLALRPGHCSSSRILSAWQGCT